MGAAIMPTDLRASEMDDEVHEPDSAVDDYVDPKDGCYAWGVIILCSFTVAAVVMGVQYSAGLINGSVQVAFGESTGTTAWVTAVAIGFLLLAMGPAGYI